MGQVVRMYIVVYEIMSLLNCLINFITTLIVITKKPLLITQPTCKRASPYSILS